MLMSWNYVSIFKLLQVIILINSCKDDIHGKIVSQEIQERPLEDISRDLRQQSGKGRRTVLVHAIIF